MAKYTIEIGPDDIFFEEEGIESGSEDEYKEKKSFSEGNESGIDEGILTEADISSDDEELVYGEIPEWPHEHSDDERYLQKTLGENYRTIEVKQAAENRFSSRDAWKEAIKNDWIAKAQRLLLQKNHMEEYKKILDESYSEIGGKLWDLYHGQPNLQRLIDALHDIDDGDCERIRDQMEAIKSQYAELIKDDKSLNKEWNRLLAQEMEINRYFGELSDLEEEYPSNCKDFINEIKQTHAFICQAEEKGEVSDAWMKENNPNLHDDIRQNRVKALYNYNNPSRIRFSEDIFKHQDALEKQQKTTGILPTYYYPKYYKDVYGVFRVNRVMRNDAAPPLPCRYYDSYDPRKYQGTEPLLYVDQEAKYPLPPAHLSQIDVSKLKPASHPPTWRERVMAQEEETAKGI